MERGRGGKGEKERWETTCLTSPPPHWLVPQIPSMLITLNLSSVEQRRITADFALCYKIVYNLVDVESDMFSSWLTEHADTHSWS